MTPRRRVATLLHYSCAAGAIMVAGYAAPAAAQGFQGTPTIVTGGVTITRTPGHDEIAIDTQTALIDWSSFNPSPVGPLDFLPAANSVNYLGTNGNFTVLNRVLPNATVPIMLNGAISSQIGGAAQPTTGGSVWFYTPGGFMVGGTATFNVGGIVLTANAVQLDANNGFNPNVVRFIGTNGSTAGVSIAAGAQINALNYVALIAPKIVQSGSIRSDGQIAYIAAETGTLTMPLGGGLFSIAIDAGGGTTVGGTAIAHDGSTGGVVTVGSALNKRIYMVTVAKNNAVTMLLGGSIGYDLSAAAVGNTVVLSAGRDVANGDAVMTGAAAGPAASIQLTNAALTTPLIASASGDITLLAQVGGTLSLTGNTLAVADGNVTARATTGTINVSGSLTLQSARFGLDAGTAQVIADKGGQVNVKGALGVFADGDGVRRGFKAGGNATGGVASVSADGGSITANALTVSATGVAQPVVGAPATSRGGTAFVQLSNGATLNVGPIIIDASGGVGPNGIVANNPLGGGATGIGGTATLTVDNAVFAPNAPLTIAARAVGGSGQTGGGAAAGGTVLVQSINGGALTLPGLSIDVAGTGGASAGGAGGAGQGGGATMRAQNGAITIADLAGPQALTINAQGRGGTGIAGVIGGTGGTITLGANGAPLSAGTTSLFADGNAGGAGGTVSLAVADAGGAGGSMTLGDTTLSANGGNGGKIALTNTSSAASPAMRFASLNASALGAVIAGGSSFALNAEGNRIAVTGNATIATGGDQTYIASGGGGFTVGNTLLATAGGAVSLVHTGNAGAVDTVNAGDADVRGQSITVGTGAILGAPRTINLTAVNGIDAATLRAGTSIDGTAGGAVTLGNVTVTAPAQANGGGGLDTSVGRISFVAGVTGGASYRAFDLTVNGRLSANALIDLTAGQDVRIGPAGLLTSANRIQIAAGDDILVSPGGAIAAGQGPLGGNPVNAGLDLISGQLTLVAPPPAGNVAAIIANGTLSSGESAMRLLGGAVVVAGPITAGSLTVDIAGTATGTDGGQLSGNCQGRDVCLDAINVSGALAIGQGGTGAPNNVGIASGTVGGAMLVNAATGIRLGRTAATATLSTGGPTRLVSGGTIDLLGALTFSATGPLGLRAGGSVTGLTSSVRGNGDVALTIGGNLNLASLTAGGALTGADANGLASGLPGVAGSATLGTLTVNGGDINLTAPGGITIGQVLVSEGRLVRLDAQGSALRVTTIVGGPLGVAGGITLNGGSVTADRLQARNAVTLTATGAVTVTTDVAASGVTAQGSSVLLNALGPLAIASIVATNGDATANSGGNLTVVAGQASGAITLTSGGGITADRLRAGGAASLIATGAVTVSTDIVANGVTARGSSVTLNALGPLAITSMIATNGDATARSGGNLSIGLGQASGGITLTAGGGITADRLRAGNAATLTATGAVAVTTDVAAGSVAAQGSSVLLNALGPLAITSIVATNGDATANSGGDLTVAAGQATGGVILTSQRTATLNGAITAGTAMNATGLAIAANGLLRAPQIALRSAAMQIGGAAQIGVTGLTQNVGFTNTGAGASFVGSAGGAGYSLTNAGLGRVQSRDITVALPGDATISDLALSGAVNLGGTFSITTPGTITVNGVVGLTNAIAANAITFNAGPAIRVVTPTGSIAIRSAAAAPVGTLTLNAGTIAVASQAALTDIVAAGDVTARNARLAVNDGPVNDQGYLIAGGMRFSVTTGLYIQNSGSASPSLTARRGFTIGDGGLTISTLGAQPAGIVINGRQLLADGTIVTGAPLIPRITLNGGPARATLFDPLSTVNGCRIVVGVCPNDVVKPSTLVAVRDAIGLVGGGTTPGLSPPVAAAAVNGVIPPIIVPAIGIEGIDPYSVEPPIDEPVIGVGNEDVWSDGKQAP